MVLLPSTAMASRSTISGWSVATREQITPGMRGCGCETGAEAQNDAAAWVTALGALGLMRLRRRRVR